MFLPTLLIALVFPPLLFAQEAVQLRRAAAPGAPIAIVMPAGRVEVVGVSADSVVVTGNARGNPVRLRQRADTLVLSQTDGTVQLSIRVPHNSDVLVRSASAEIVVRAPFRRAVLRSISGRIVVRAPVAEIEAHTVTGQILFDDHGVRHATISSFTGQIIYSAMAPGRGHVTLRNHSGQVVLSGRLPETVDAGTVYGRIYDQSKVRGTGAARITVRTFTGDVLLRD